MQTSFMSDSKVLCKVEKSLSQAENFRIKYCFQEQFLKKISEIQGFSRPLGHFQVFFAEFRPFSRLNLENLDFQGF